jgi:Glycosyltransferase family 29 (sialyltransferase)
MILTKSSNPLSPFNIRSLYDNLPYQIIFPQRDQSYTMCIFGSSGNVLQQKRQIPSIDVSIRINHAPTKQYESFVGNRTDIRWIAFNAFSIVLQSCQNRHIDPQHEIWIIWGPPQHMASILSAWNQYRLSRLPMPKHIYLIMPTFLQYVDQMYQQITHRKRMEDGIWWSSGYLAHVFFISICNPTQVQLYHYGFYNPNQSTGSVGYHYWERDRGGESQHILGQQSSRMGHKFYLEHHMYQYWLQQGLINPLEMHLIHRSNQKKENKNENNQREQEEEPRDTRMAMTTNDIENEGKDSR